MKGYLYLKKISAVSAWSVMASLKMEGVVNGGALNHRDDCTNIRLHQ